MLHLFFSDILSLRYHVTNQIYVSHNLTNGVVTVIDGNTNALIGTPIPVGNQPVGVAPVTLEIDHADRTHAAIVVRRARGEYPTDAEIKRNG